VQKIAIGYVLWNLDGHQRLATIDRIGVDWNYRYDPDGKTQDNLGVGTAMLRKCIAELVGRVETIRANAIPNTLGFYERLNFKKTVERGPVGTDTIVVELRVPSSVPGDVNQCDAGDGNGYPESSGSPGGNGAGGGRSDIHSAAAAQLRSRPWTLSFESQSGVDGLSSLPTLYPAERSTYYRSGARDGDMVNLVPDRNDIIYMGGGTFGQVFVASIKVLSTGTLLPVAIKAVPEGKGLVLTKAHRRAKKMLLAEMQALTLMAECDRIVNGYFLAGDGGIDKSYATQRWLVMELVGGGSLRDVSSRRRNALWPRTNAGVRPVLQCCRDVCVAVAAMKAAGVAHNDLKPANISLEMRAGKTVARLKLVDLGGVSPAEYTDMDKKTALQLQACTAGYEAPERIKNALTGKRGREGQPWQWDLFSLGCVCVCIITRCKCITEVLDRVREAMGSRYTDNTSTITDSKRWEEWRSCKDSGRISQPKQGAFGRALRGLIDEGLPGDAYLSVRDMVWSLLSWDGTLRPSAERCVRVLTAALELLC
jgi:serine/threonine protein kinase